MTRRFVAIVIIANIVMGSLLYLSSQLVLLNLNAPPQSPITISGFDVFSIYVQPPQVGSGVILPIAWSIPNYPSYVFVLFLVVNACFAVKLLIDKKTK